MPGLARSPSRPGRSSSGVWSPREIPASRRVSFDDDREFQVGSSTSHLHQAGPSHSVGRDGRTPSRQREGEGEDSLRGRKGKRFSFASAFFEAMKDRVRSRSPMVDRGDVTPPRGRTRDRTFLDPGETTPVKERSALGRVAEAVGLEAEDGREHGEGWKEFRKGALFACSKLHGTYVSYVRRVHLSNLLRDTGQFPTYSARRLWFCYMETQSCRTPSWCVQAEADRGARHHSSCDAGRGRHRGVRKHRRGAPVGYADAVSHRDLWTKLLHRRNDACHHHVHAMDENEDPPYICTNRRYGIAHPTSITNAEQGRQSASTIGLGSDALHEQTPSTGCLFLRSSTRRRMALPYSP